jgi:hypothetical protein
MKNSSGEFKPKTFSVYGPIQYSGAQILPQMTSTRTLTIPMKRTLNNTYSSFDDLLPDSPEAVELRENLYLARLCYGFKALQIYDSIKPTDFGLRNREWELAHPLLAVAMLIDKSLIKYVLEFLKQSNEESSDITDRDEFKVLSVLSALVTQPHWSDMGLPASDLVYMVVCQFDESAFEWNSKRVLRACRLLNIDRYMADGKNKVRVLKSQIQDLSSRYLPVDEHNSQSNQSTRSTVSTPTASFWEGVALAPSENKENDSDVPVTIPTFSSFPP